MRREVVYWVPERKRDRNNDYIGPVPDDIMIGGVVIWPRASEEKDGGEVNIDGQNLRLPDNSITRQIQSDHQIRLRGELHMVDEPPARYIGKAVMIKTKRVTT